MEATAIFTAEGDFQATLRAESALRNAGFSYGSGQRDAPRGVMFGDYYIGKWRNIKSADRAKLDGVMTGDMREGPVAVRLLDVASHEAKEAFSAVQRAAQDQSINKSLGGG